MRNDKTRLFLNARLNQARLLRSAVLNALGAAMVCVFLLCAAESASANYTVVTTGETDLRNAVTLANATAVDDIIDINIPANDPGCNLAGVCTIKLTGGELVVNLTSTAGKLTIRNASGAGKLLISGNNQSRVFFVNAGDLTLDGVTVTNGNGINATDPYFGLTGLGGGIFAEGRDSGKTAALTIINSTVSGSTAKDGGGIYAYGAAVTVMNSTISGNTTSTTSNFGGGSLNSSNSIITITNSTVSGNTSPDGSGGIVNGIYSTMTITNSTVSSNTSQSFGGGIVNSGALNILNSTVNGNASQDTGGGIDNDGTMTITNTTISNNTSQSTGGGISNYSDVNTKTSLRNTIVAGNSATGGKPDVSHGSADTFTSNGNNLIGNANDTGSLIIWVTTGESDILNQSPRLAPLANNGGATQTQALLANSPAINKGNNCVLTANGCGDNNPALTTDQRGAGFPRQVGAAVDIGAFEYNAATARKIAFDFDGDGKTDLSVFRPSNAVWYSQNSTSGFSATGWGLASDKLTPADFDGDGKTDLTVWRESSSDPDHSYFYILQSSTNTFRSAQFGRIGDNPYFSGDWDGDGKADPTVFRDTGSGQTYFYYAPSSQPSVNFVSVPWGITGDKPVRGDFDGDGKQDAAVFRPSNGVWYILQSSNNQFKADSWGSSGDKLIAADYDGDGKTDLAVLRNAVWYIRQSSDSQNKIVNWGLSSDTAVPADYDGDGKADIAVYRGGVWYIIQSSNGQIRYDNFGATGDLPVPFVN